MEIKTTKRAPERRIFRIDVSQVDSDKVEETIRKAVKELKMEPEVKLSLPSTP